MKKKIFIIIIVIWVAVSFLLVNNYNKKDTEWPCIKQWNCID